MGFKNRANKCIVTLSWYCVVKSRIASPFNWLIVTGFSFGAGETITHKATRLRNDVPPPALELIT